MRAEKKIASFFDIPERELLFFRDAINDMTRNMTGIHPARNIPTRRLRYRGIHSIRPSVPCSDKSHKQKRLVPIRATNGRSDAGFLFLNVHVLFFNGSFLCSSVYAPSLIVVYMIFPSVEIVTICHGINFPLALRASVAAFASPPQQGTSIRTIVRLCMSFSVRIVVNFSV